MRNVPKVIGIKQTTKALQKNEAAVLYIAKDAENRVTEPLETLAKEKGVQIIKVPSMRELGKAFGIEVGAATAAILIQK
ncbi:MAG: hypothetical protein VR72_04455 [Clostridiaceae bacterium BRH_c20a]|nr:MAG: hypothetical protein VR72_04455 [Clostridiaceae bacterium BRH_c20a]